MYYIIYSHIYSEQTKYKCQTNLYSERLGKDREINDVILHYKILAIYIYYHKKIITQKTMEQLLIKEYRKSQKRIKIKKTLRKLNPFYREPKIIYIVQKNYYRKW